MLISFDKIYRYIGPRFIIKGVLYTYFIIKRGKLLIKSKFILIFLPLPAKCGHEGSEGIRPPWDNGRT